MKLLKYKILTDNALKKQKKVLAAMQSIDKNFKLGYRTFDNKKNKDPIDQHKENPHYDNNHKSI